MQIITEQQVADILDPEKAFFAVQEVFASMESSAWNFPVVRESLGYQDALYGFKSGFDPASGALGLKAGGYWPNNFSNGIANHQSSIFLFDPDTGRAGRCLPVILSLRSGLQPRQRSLSTSLRLITLLPWAWLVLGISQPFSLRLRFA